MLTLGIVSVDRIIDVTKQHKDIGYERRNCFCQTPECGAGGRGN